MNVLTILNRKLLSVLAVALLVAAFILWEHFNGGVMVHHPLADEDLPGISNWWGLLTVPALSFFVLWLVDRRVSAHEDQKVATQRVTKHFLGGLIFGLIVALLWEVGAAEVLQFVILVPLVIALFIPVHFPECLLGFVLGMTFTFGGVLPIMIGIVVLVLAAIVHLVIHGGFQWLKTKLN